MAKYQYVAVIWQEDSKMSVRISLTYFLLQLQWYLHALEYILLF